jgi:hypothetical protein
MPTSVISYTGAEGQAFEMYRTFGTHHRFRLVRSTGRRAFFSRLRQQYSGNGWSL